MPLEKIPALVEERRIKNYMGMMKRLSHLRIEISREMD